MAWQSEQQPPDLDEAWRKCHAKLKALLSSNATSNNTNVFGKRAGIVLGIILLIWFLSGIFSVSSAEQAVVLRLNHYVKTLSAGWHWIPRFFEKKYIVNVGIQKLAYGTPDKLEELLTQNGEFISVASVLQFRIADPYAYLFNVRHPNASLQQAVATAFQEVVSQHPLYDLFVEPIDLSNQVLTQLRKIWESYHTGIEIIDLQIQTLTVPQEARKAFDEAKQARQNSQEMMNAASDYAKAITAVATTKAAILRKKAEAYKEQVILRALGETEDFLKLLPQYVRAPRVMRERLYIETMESILSQSSKILLDTSGNNSVLSLPLEQLIKSVPEEIKPPLAQKNQMNKEQMADKKENSLAELQNTPDRAKKAVQRAFNQREQSLRNLQQRGSGYDGGEE